MSSEYKKDIKYIKNTCFWFMRNNWEEVNGQKLRKCRDGSFCKFIHLTGKECQEMIKDWNGLTDCPSCVYKSTPFPEGLDEWDKIQEKIRREMPCWNGCKNGKVLKRNLVLKHAKIRNWCDCEKEKKTGTSYYPGYSHPSGEKDTYVCTTCKCIKQVG